ncbi:hypothetical protein KKG65_03090, partial [Patescibacteria group bacterium]|nr:hypothetical protein [Patescibacteria group bacterium]
SLDNLKNKYPEKAIIFDDFINTFLPNTNFWKLIAQPIDSDTAYQLTSTEILTKFLEKNQTSSESPVLN